MRKTKLCGVELSQMKKQRTETISGITWLDIKITEYLNKRENEKYVRSKTAVRDFREILGVLKFLYMTHMITPNEFANLCECLSYKREEKDNEPI